MLKLQNISKDYLVGDEIVHALKNISLTFRDQEFVAVLGPSGCGKTTMLNLIGGLDRYNDGDLIINGRSTEEYTQKDWDAYRNHSIGFVFQSYNLIPHQTVLKNVELALTLSGVGKGERKRRAKEVLEKVGLGDQLNKKPNQMSGGQMQRVAIARAMVNDPDILLADEPTGALDTETSIQIMELLKEISKTKLVIMVTHNPDLADKYATRTVNLLDGKIIGDTMPVSEEEEKEAQPKEDRTSMSYLTALSLSLNNLLTKKTRTILTAFAGSIGIIGIALILSLSNGVNSYINRVQEETLSTYPLMIQKQTADTSALLTALLNVDTGSDEPHAAGRVYSSNAMGEMMNAMLAEIKINDLKSFKAFLDGNDELKDLVTDIQYTYTSEPNIYMYDLSNGPVQLNPSTILTSMYSAMGASESSLSDLTSMSSLYGGSSNMSVWTQMIDNEELVHSTYELIAGKWPEEWNEVLLIVDKHDEISDYALYSLGLKDPGEVEGKIRKMLMGERIESEKISFSYDDILNLSFRLVLPADYYQYNTLTKSWENKQNDRDYMTKLLSDSAKCAELKVVGIIRPDEEAVAASMTGAIAYTEKLTEYIVTRSAECPIVKAQLENPEIDVFTGIPFEKPKEMTPQEIRLEFLRSYELMSEEEKAQTETMLAYIIQSDENGQFDQAKQWMASGQKLSIRDFVTMIPDEMLAEMYKMSANQETKNTYDTNLVLLGYAELDNPFMISIYPKDFHAKDRIVEIIAEYNKEQPEDKQIEYTDFIALLMSSVSTIINAITYILIAFVAISLVVSSIMIGIITYISVLERTKEIGILRAIGASKRDISRVFNAETMIIGFIAGTLGILVTVLLNIPINIIIHQYTNISGLSKLPILGAVILIVISIVLTLIAGLIPSRIAANKDPVAALRSE
ncbi:MAG: ABC transporter ATP-binding protein/permease [Lachnospiraceae bacterium]|nr:ABC transporter ATP-binding protein/permease [Lachnospiraceae bacterium]